LTEIRLISQISILELKFDAPAGTVADQRLPIIGRPAEGQSPCRLQSPADRTGHEAASHKFGME
jgi:hypothetical protein